MCVCTCWCLELNRHLVSRHPSPARAFLCSASVWLTVALCWLAGTKGGHAARGSSQSHPLTLPRIGEIRSLPDLGEIRGGQHKLWESYKASADSNSPSLHVPSNSETRASSQAKKPSRKGSIPLPVGMAILGSFLGDGAGWLGGWQSVFPLA